VWEETNSAADFWLRMQEIDEKYPDVEIIL